MTLIKIAMQAKKIVRHLTLSTFNIFILFWTIFLIDGHQNFTFQYENNYLKIISKRIGCQY
jgi:hypothetical protein